MGSRNERDSAGHLDQAGWAAVVDYAAAAFPAPTGRLRPAPTASRSSSSRPTAGLFTPCIAAGIHTNPLGRGDSPLLTEMGADEIAPLAPAAVADRWEGRRGGQVVRYWRAMAWEAAERSGRVWLPRIWPVYRIVTLVRRFQWGAVGLWLTRHRPGSYPQWMSPRWVSWSLWSGWRTGYDGYQSLNNLINPQPSHEELVMAGAAAAAPSGVPGDRAGTCRSRRGDSPVAQP